MPITPGTELNVVDPLNSTTALLGGGGTFTGTFIDVTGFTSVAVLLNSNASAAFDGVRLQWSTDGVNIDTEQRFGGGQDQIDGRVKARFFRLQYVNGGIPQTHFRAQTLLRRGTPSGSVSPAGLDLVPFGHDAQVVESILNATRLEDPDDIVHLRAQNDAFLITANGPNTGAFSNRVVAAQTFFSQPLDLFGIFSGNRDGFHVFNNTIRGNLYIKLGGFSVSTTDFHVKVPPQHAWAVTTSTRIYPAAQVNGIWDVADGDALSWEWL